MDESTQKITCFLKLAAEKSNVKKFKTSSRNSKKEKDDMPLFDSECDTNKKALTDLAKEIKQNSKNCSLRNKLSIQKKSFRKLIKCKKNLYTKQIVEEMNKNHFDPKTFWSLLNKLKAKESKYKDYICSISPFQWVNYFKNLLFQYNSNLIKHAIADNTELSLNAGISVAEVTFTLKQLKRASGLDQLSNEMLKSFGHLYPEFLSSFFTKLFFENKFPKLWTTGLITPMFRKGPKSSVSNYRGIMVLSCLGKLFKILNERLLKYFIQKKILAKEQIGFLRGNRTSDNLIILHSLVQEKFKSGKNLFACFVDFEKAFDKIPRNRLIEKLCNLGISGNFLGTIENMYQNIKMMKDA